MEKIEFPLKLEENAMECHGIKLDRSHGAPLRSIRSEGNQEVQFVQQLHFLIG